MEKDIQKKSMYAYESRRTYTHQNCICVETILQKKLAYVEKDLHVEKDLRKRCMYGFYSHTSMHTHLCICGKDLVPIHIHLCTHIYVYVARIFKRDVCILFIHKDCSHVSFKSPFPHIHIFFTLFFKTHKRFFCRSLFVW